MNTHESYRQFEKAWHVANSLPLASEVSNVRSGAIVGELGKSENVGVVTKGEPYVEGSLRPEYQQITIFLQDGQIHTVNNVQIAFSHESPQAELALDLASRLQPR